MDNQYINTFADFQTENNDQLYPVERTECNSGYWGDLMVDALGPGTHDAMPNNVDGDFGSGHEQMER